MSVKGNIETKKPAKIKKDNHINIPLTILLFIGCLTVIFPLYMTVIIALKSPSEMTNDAMGALSFPKAFSLDNFAEAMRVTNFGMSLLNSLIITGVTVLLALIIHSMAGYAIGRAMVRHKSFKFIYFYIVSGMFVPFAILMMPLVKQTAILGIDNMFGVIILYTVFYMPMKIADKGFWIYDFALPVITLHALFNHTGKYLKKWLEMCPMKQFTTLDTHDGIGIVDVKNLIPDDEIENVKEQMYSRRANVKKIYSSEAYNNLDIYQVNTTYYSAPGNNDNAYLLARAIQFFAPGIPQVYYVGLLAGENDIELMERTKNGRDINRHYYSADDIDKEQDKEVVRKLKELMELRNFHAAFGLDGSISATADGDRISITRTCGNSELTLNANLTDYSFTIG